MVIPVLPERLARKMTATICRTVASISVAVSVGCGAGDPIVPRRTEPFLHLVLAPDLRLYPVQDPPADQFAVLLTTGTPLESTCRVAERFEMRRLRDGALFGWRPTGSCRPILAGEHLDAFDNANYVLAEIVGPDSIGALGLSSGDEYELLIDSEGVQLRGRTVIPAAFSVTISAEGGARRLVWPRVPGAGGYIVQINGSSVIQADTIFPLDVTRGIATVTALDENLYAYQIDKQRARAGINQGFGVFGAMKRAHLTF